MLLRQVGGKGQEKLLAARAVARGENLTIKTTITYLHTGGTPVDWSGAARAWLLEAPPTAEAPATAAALAEVTSGFSVVLGGRGGAAHVQATDCPDCARAALSALGPVPAAQAVFAGALAALVYQRHALGLDAARLPALRAHFSSWEASRLACDAHR